MHTNHRRKMKRDPRYYRHGQRWWVDSSLKKCWQRIFWAKFRMLEQTLIKHEEWDDLPTRIHKNILWDLS